MDCSFVLQNNFFKNFIPGMTGVFFNGEPVSSVSSTSTSVASQVIFNAKVFNIQRVSFASLSCGTVKILKEDIFNQHSRKPRCVPKMLSLRKTKNGFRTFPICLDFDVQITNFRNFAVPNDKLSNETPCMSLYFYVCYF